MVGCDGRTAKATVDAIVDKCRDEGRSPMSALVDVAHAAGHDDATGNMDYVGEWVQTNGEPTFDKLLGWAAGIDHGFYKAAHGMAHLPSAHPLALGDKYGLVVVEHRQTQEAFVVPFTDGSREDSRELVDRIKETKDPRSGVWDERTVVLCHS